MIKGILEMFFFVFSHDWAKLSVNNIIQPSPQQLLILSISSVFTIAKVQTLMRTLDPKSAGGPHVPPIFLKSCEYSLSLPLPHLFSLSYTNSYLPPSWMIAYITPIFKKGDPARCLKLSTNILNINYL